MERLINIKEAAELLGRSTHSVRELAKGGELQYTQHGSRGCLMFRESWLEAFVEKGKGLSHVERPAQRRTARRELSWGQVLSV